MRQHRFFINQDLSKVFETKPAVFTYEEEKGRNLVNQWKNVFRYKQGDQVLLFDGRSEYQAEIMELKNNIKFLLREKTRELKEKKEKIYLALAVLKGEHTPKW